MELIDARVETLDSSSDYIHDLINKITDIKIKNEDYKAVYNQLKNEGKTTSLDILQQEGIYNQLNKWIEETKNKVVDKTIELSSFPLID
jgi:hypothetical protein